MNVKTQMQRDTYWDYARLAATGVTSQAFFNVPSGQSDPVSGLQKTLEETNLNKSAQLPYKFHLRQLRTHIAILPKARQPANINDTTVTVTKWIRGLANTFANIQAAGVLSIRINQKLVHQINQPFRKCGIGFGVDIDAIQSNDTYALFPQQNWRALLYDVTPEIYFTPTDQISVVIDFPNTCPVLTNLVNSTTPYVNLGVWFEGYSEIPVG